MTDQTIHVRMLSPQQIFLEVDALSISSKNSAGNFDILPQHANFVTLIENQPIIVRLPNKKHLTFGLPIAIVFATNNQVSIYTYLQPQKEK